ncbi:MAG: competence/damage-inducible protein A [Candidatus Omnitrophica bacterium]|nr:competence/damage-inducible protein A [Candidatus Omnitrophota bacterium]
MNAEIIAVGTELLLGFVTNTDTVYLSRVLAGLGIDCFHHVTVGDNPQRLAQALETALSRADLVITCGGLGPTVDDITLETTASAAGRRLILNRRILRQIKARFAHQGIRMPKANIRQAMVPEGAVPFPNGVGTAPGFLLVIRNNRMLVALPGPPAELIPMTEKHLIPRLRRRAGKTVIRSRTLKVTGLTESEVDAKVRDILALKDGVTVGIYAHPGQVDLRITAKAPSPAAAQRAIARVEGRIRRRLKTLVFGADGQTLEAVVGLLLRKKGLTLAAAESCTGGLIQHRITEVPGSSDYFLGGVVAYANKLKKRGLAVSPALLARHGAVSAQAARAMAQGARRLAQSDLGLAVTGIAGPAGGTKKKPVGLVYLALAAPKQMRVYRLRFTGSRSAIKFKASQAALDLVRRYAGVHRG